MKKRIFCIAAALLSFLLLFCFAACGEDDVTDPSVPQQEEEEEEKQEKEEIPLEPELDPNQQPEFNPGFGKA